MTLISSKDLKALSDRIFTYLTNKENEIMATLKDVQNKIDELKGIVTTEAEEVSSAVASLKQTIADLQTQIAKGVPATTEDLDGLISQLGGVESSVSNIIDASAPTV